MDLWAVRAVMLTGAAARHERKRLQRPGDGDRLW